mmetsp:Transcript_30264/g.41030  ORF Transcript_30264/g.41030 Transcript_30264/m.41030 type:complete len:115 (-) Transcript_30264:563-907(-)
MLTRGVLGNSELWLSSGVAPAPTDGDILEIFPPFRLEVAPGGQGGGGKRTLVDAGSDAEFRAINVRSSEAQAAPKNQYRQSYLEDSGQAGDLRVSTIVAGDPVIVGAVFVHQRQ